jgi:hypothetical protein
MKNSFLILKFKKCMVRRFVHFEILCTIKYQYGEKFLLRKIKFYLRTGNLPTAYKNYLQIVLVRGKIAGLERRYLFISGLPT